MGPGADEPDGAADHAVPALLQQDARAYERFLSAVLHHLSDALVACDADGRLTVFNPAAQRLHGLPATPVPPEQWASYYDLFEADGATPLSPDRIPLVRALRGETVRDVEMVVARRGEPPHRLLASGQRIVAADGGVLGAFVVMHDVTEKHTAEALRVQQLAAMDSVRRLQQLNAAAVAVNRSTDVAGALEAVVEQSVEIIGARQAVARLTRGQDWSRANAAFAPSEEHAGGRPYDAPPDGSSLCTLVCESNQPVRLTQAELEAHPQWRGSGQHAPDHPPMRGWLAAPFIGRDGRNLGLVQLSDKTGVGPDGSPAEFDEADEALLVQLAQLASLALEKLVEWEREHQVAVELQRSLLPQHLPELAGLDVDVAYVPGRGDLELAVGGDWFDVFELDDDHVGLALGDVVGHGLRSASLMGQIRTALRGLAMHQSDPELVVTALDRLVWTLGDGAMATLAFGVLHRPTGRLRTVLAGHPAPLVRHAGSVRGVPADPGPPLGTRFGIPFVASETTLSAGATLVMFSDGLVENRRRPIGVGLDELAARLQDGPEAPSALGPYLVEALTGDGNDDDVALLTVRRRG